VGALPSARRMTPNSGKNTQTYTGQKTRAYGQANGSGVVTVVCPS
jgi:hypothetical protein